MRLLRLYSDILVTNAKIVLIDELENGIHYSVIEKVWKGIASVAREEDLQIFATTYSYECIRAAHKGFSANDSYDLALHRLEISGDQIKAMTYDLQSEYAGNLRRYEPSRLLKKGFPDRFRKIRCCK